MDISIISNVCIRIIYAIKQIIKKGYIYRHTM